jgi:hypothetical protein
MKFGKTTVGFVVIASLLGCSKETVYFDPEENQRPSEYFSQKTDLPLITTLDCTLRELSLRNSNNSFEYEAVGDKWEIKVIYGKNGVVGGGQIGTIIGTTSSLTFFYKPALGNFGMDAWNVESVVPSALQKCA